MVGTLSPACVLGAVQACDLGEVSVNHEEVEMTRTTTEAATAPTPDAETATQGANRWRKMEIPVYDGSEDAFGWVNKLERYFRIKGAMEEEKLQAVVVALDGRALSWYQWWEPCHLHASWEQFKRAILERFQSTVRGWR
ncbi:uncharacterized protein LOC130725773 [Lotus japonicus]|uniref:uncharacterized protein LOC130725773 n=1 Tax=Lotus japonicus TaxID=34305 RepID=UPI00258D2EE1|nr:uncharacterized protein LOC130725773 [Lotus japonicus]